MLGKTNITTLSEGAIVTEVEDFKWIQMQSGVYGNFVKAIYKNDYLVAITADGTVAYTTDGEVWQTSVLEYEDCRLNDIEWDGNRFILVGSHKNENNEIKGLLTTTIDLNNYILVSGSVDEILLVFYQNNEYILIILDSRNIYSKRIGITENKISIKSEKSLNSYPVSSRSVAKNTNGILVYYAECVSPHYRHILKMINGDGQHVIKTVKRLAGDELVADIKALSVFECKDALFAMELSEYTGYNLTKVTDGNEDMTMCAGQNFLFVDGAYFNGSQLFINSHEMLVVKKDESIADKTLDDLIEIAPEFTMNCITKAFGQLYIFGNQGTILKSSVETNNESAITVQTLSAKKALSDAKQYTDEQYAILEARIAALEGATTE